MEKATPIHKKKHSFITSIGYFIMYSMVGLIPHIYRYIPFSVTESQRMYFKDPIYADLYMLAKSRAFLILTVLLIGVFVYQMMNNDINIVKDKITIATGIFAIIIILSSVMSQYQDIVYWGAKDRFEGMWIWLAYLVVFTVVRYQARDPYFRKNILKVFLFSASVMSIFGILQMMGYDIYTKSFLKYIFFPTQIASNLEMYISTNTTNILSVGALYNSNYFGVYCGLAAIVALFFYYSSDEKKFSWLYLLLLVFNYSSMITSKSEAGLLSFFISMGFMILFDKSILKVKIHRNFLMIFAIIVTDRITSSMLMYSQSSNAKYIYMCSVLFIFLCVLIGEVFIKKPTISEFIVKKRTIFSILVLIAATLIFNLSIMFMPYLPNMNSIESLVVESNFVYLKMINREPIAFKIDGQDITVFDENGNSTYINSIGKNEYFVQNHEQIYKFSLKLYSNGILLKILSPIDVAFFYDGSTFEYVDQVTGIGKIDYPEVIDYYYDRSKIYSGRGYIWSNYLKLGIDNMFLGTGLDTHSVVFPQNDVIGKNNTFYPDMVHVIIDKPHSLYLMIFVATGIVGLIMFLVFVCKCISNLITNLNDFSNDYILDILVLFVCVSGIFNDSTIPLTVLMVVFGGMSNRFRVN